MAVFVQSTYCVALPIFYILHIMINPRYIIPFVIPAKAGIRSNKMYSLSMLFNCISFLWIRAFAGMAKKNAGMTKKKMYVMVILESNFLDKLLN